MDEEMSGRKGRNHRWMECEGNETRSNLIKSVVFATMAHAVTAWSLFGSTLPRASQLLWTSTRNDVEAVSYPM